MAFLPSSRYAKLPTARVRLADGRTVTIVKLRRLPPTDGELTAMAPHDRLDVTAHERYGDSTEFWHIADANTELDAAELAIANNSIRVPKK
ncbi:MAG: hypothetical protein WKG01_35950 [Kofleriaceae bacterium]